MCGCSRGCICIPVFALGETCYTENSLTEPSKQCGYGAYCINSKCVTFFSFELGDMGLASNEVPLSFASLLCQSGMARDQDGKYVCVDAPRTLKVEGGKCKISDGTEAEPICGYNKDGLKHCPW